ncbi:hypothetical protein IC757_11705 [Wenzhouxiangella sp. AB-CW3]|uniref:hypothetical protein n=1 Tax=Wenzhouxiangella sp. AB-CW3 TaxID=2771012 RepID=UPI00168B87C3|nr:hypothetical protein [Wenzhouxiangella sp. AB-CW3]QOC21703.1 hypothetical protein IC757_11705 [Wenzhouxiangella sp. AB-CW3]
MIVAARTCLLLIVSGILLAGCVGTVTQPDATTFDQSRSAYLLDHGRHSTLVLTREDDSMVRYLYGEWRWYALQETGFFRVWPTLFFPTQAALGRKELAGPPDEAAIRRQVPVVIREIHELAAESEHIDALDRKLEQRFNDNIDTLHYNPNYDLEFVHDPVDYTVFYNSNHVVADWLRELGIEVRGNPIWGTWRVINPAGK